MTFVHIREPASRQLANVISLHFSVTSPIKEILRQQLIALRSELGIEQEEMGKRLGVSREWVSKLENGREEFSEYVQMKMDALVKSQHLLEEGAPYRISGSPGASGPAAPAALSQRMLHPRHSPKPETPTREQCLAHLKEYLARAELAEGGLGYAWVKIKKHFPLDDFEPAEKEI